MPHVLQFATTSYHCLNFRTLGVVSASGHTPAGITHVAEVRDLRGVSNCQGTGWKPFTMELGQTIIREADTKAIKKFCSEYAAIECSFCHKAQNKVNSPTTQSCKEILKAAHLELS